MVIVSNLLPSAPELSVSQSSSTEIRVERVTHNWTVKNFSHCYQEYLENFVHLTKGHKLLSEERSKMCKSIFTFYRRRSADMVCKDLSKREWRKQQRFRILMLKSTVRSTSVEV